MPLLFALSMLLILYLKPKGLRGIIEEKLTSFTTQNKLEKDKYHSFKDISLPSLDEKAQIEHIVVSRFGIFLIEKKYMKGWIYGGKKRKEWTQKQPSRKFTFQNPLLRNSKNINILSHMLNVPDDKFHSLIAFTGNCIFKSAMPDNVTGKNYIDYIKSKKTEVFTQEEMLDCVNKIKNLKKERTRPTCRKQVTYLRQPFRT